MINPNKKEKATATVTSLVRRSDGTIRDIEFTLEGGQVLGGVLGLDHKTIEVGDKVKIEVGFRITSDSYVVESFKRVPVSRKGAAMARLSSDINSSGFGGGR
jgi:hypothetical protein